MNALDQWEAEAKDAKGLAYTAQMYDESQRRILALIRLVREKDEVLQKYAIYPDDILYFDPNIKTDPREIVKNITIPIAKHAREALALTDQLGKEEG